MADPPEREVGKTQSGGWKLAKLRARMATEKEIVIKFLDKKKQLDKDEVLLDISKLWIKETDMERIPEIDRSIPTGWIAWKKILQDEEELFLKKRKKLKIGKKKDLYLQRIAPDQLLTGWRGWWSRIEAESMREGKEKEKKERLRKQLAGMPKIETYFKPYCSNGNFRMENVQNTEMAQNVLTHTPGVYFSPKRKLQFRNQDFEESPSKKQRNFKENLSFWKEIEGGGNNTENNAHATPGPLINIYTCANKTDDTVKSDIVTQRD